MRAFSEQFVGHDASIDRFIQPVCCGACRPAPQRPLRAPAHSTDSYGHPKEWSYGSRPASRQWNTWWHVEQTRRIPYQPTLVPRHEGHRPGVLGSASRRTSMVSTTPSPPPRVSARRWCRHQAACHHRAYGLTKRRMNVCRERHRLRAHTHRLMTSGAESSVSPRIGYGPSIAFR